ncbi:EF-hand calcium-binding protein 1 [Heterocephalus glaber]|uniref:EF-hand calcium-binding protein 1 n=1 Tax=Heterocephalus glaber TaxID=10181 RepID=G5BBP4_HETGA|nr:EF-hand calcium-binding protein 1 [Heterocephalus glaber]
MEESRETSPSSNSSQELSSALQLSKGMSIFLDILRRADKNDDGKLSFEEFKAYFADGVLSGEELHELFHTIDTHNTKQGPSKPEVLSIQWPGKRSSRRVQRHNSFSPNSPQFNISTPGSLEEDNQWMTQINRLQKLIDRLEKKDLKLEPLEEEVIEGNTKSHIMLVQRQMSVIEEDLEEFQLALKHYVESASAQSGCLRISVQKLSNESRYIIYEFWENSSVWNSHLQMNYSKTFQRSNVDFLETPELISTMLVPGNYSGFTILLCVCILSVLSVVFKK